MNFLTPIYGWVFRKMAAKAIARAIKTALALLAIKLPLLQQALRAYGLEISLSWDEAALTAAVLGGVTGALEGALNLARGALGAGKSGPEDTGAAPASGQE